MAIALFLAINIWAGEPFKFNKGQRVYVVAVESESRDLSLTTANLEVERLAKKQFKRNKVFVIANTLRDADFVFFVMLDRTSRDFDEIALAVVPIVYERAGKNLDALRNSALWQSDNHLKRGRHAALAAATVGYSSFFDHPSVVQGLVKEFQKAVER